jgi:hypothetical protein
VRLFDEAVTDWYVWIVTHRNYWIWTFTDCLQGNEALHRDRLSTTSMGGRPPRCLALHLPCIYGFQ